MGMKKKPGAEGRCSRTRANVEPCLSQVTIRCSVQADGIMAKDRALGRLKRIMSLASQSLYRLLLQCDRVP